MRKWKKRAGKMSERKAESYGMEGKLKKRAGAYFYDEKQEEMQRKSSDSKEEEKATIREERLEAIGKF